MLLAVSVLLRQLVLWGRMKTSHVEFFFVKAIAFGVLDKEPVIGWCRSARDPIPSVVCIYIYIYDHITLLRQVCVRNVCLVATTQDGFNKIVKEGDIYSSAFFGRSAIYWSDSNCLVVLEEAKKE